MEDNILQQIKKEKKNFRTKRIKIVDNFLFNQYETIQQIYRYYHSKYKSGEVDNQGDKKYFYNIVRAPCNVSTKAIDFDTKDIRLQTAAGADPHTTWYLERDLKFWFKDKQFGTILNRLFHELPIYGTCVLKMVQGVPFFVDLRNFICDPSADSLKEANYIIEEHPYSIVEFRNVGEEKWDTDLVEEIIEKHKDSLQKKSEYSKREEITVYERYGEVKEDSGYTYKKVVIADVGREDYILDEKEIDELPYREFHWEKIPGRWLGVGRVEVLFDAQIRVNELSNQQVKSSYWSALRLWQTRDDTVQRNLMTQTENGDVLTVDSELSQVDMSDRNLAHYNQELSRWLANREEMSFSSDVMKGQRPPSGTTLGSVRIAAGMAGSYFAQIQENIAEKIKELFYEDIIPQFKKQNKGEHILRIAGDDLDKLHQLIINKKTRESLYDFMVDNNGKLPSKMLMETKKMAIDAMVKRGREKQVRIPKGFYKNLKYKIDITITGEAMDTQQRASASFAALQAITADPTILQDPTKRKFFNNWLEQQGISPVEVSPESGQKGVGRLQMGGGGVAAPRMPSPGNTAKVEKTL